MTVYRCMNDQVYVRFQPNGLGCDQPDTRRFNPDVARYCRENPNASIVPKAVSGHGAPYEWKCAGGKAVIDFAEALDARGFRRDMWTAVAGVR
ncbi:MAG: hypothetical protein WAU78_02730 [Roseiarcus sp.]